MPEKPQITTGSDNRTPTTMEQQGDSNWAQATFSRDGYHETIGATTDDAQTDPAQDATLMEVQKGALTQLNASLAQLGSILSALQGTLAVNVGNFPATQVVSVSNGNVALSEELPAGTQEIGKVAQGAAGVTPWPFKVANSTYVLTPGFVHGSKTVTNVAAELFAGASRKANRVGMAVYIKGSAVIAWGGSSVTITNGGEINPGDWFPWQFDPNQPTPIYAIASVNTEVRVVEW